MVTRVEIKEGLELVVTQLTKEYKCANDNLVIYFVKVNSFLKRFNIVKIEHVPHIDNQEAKDIA